MLRVDPVVGTLRRRAMYQAIRAATITAALRERIRIIHVSLQREHIHMIIEAVDRAALSSGMQGFQVSAARYINGALAREQWRSHRGQKRGASEHGASDAQPSDGSAWRRRSRRPRRCGRVFIERYYVEVLTSPTQAHRALRYVLCNWRGHGEDRFGSASTWLVDPFSSGILFPHWQELEGQYFMWPIGRDYDPLIVYLPTTWLLAEGWKRIGPISARSVPSSKSGRGAPAGSDVARARGAARGSCEVA